jgi:hypothetical protein
MITDLGFGRATDSATAEAQIARKNAMLRFFHQAC